MDAPHSKLFRGWDVFSAQELLIHLKVSDDLRHMRFVVRRTRLAAVISSSRKPVSAKQNLSPPRSRGRTILCQLFGFALLLFSSPARAQSPENAAHELAMKVCLGGHRQPVRVHWQESAGSPAYLSEARKKAFLDQISACGI